MKSDKKIQKILKSKIFYGKDLSCDVKIAQNYDTIVETVDLITLPPPKIKLIILYKTC